MKKLFYTLALFCSGMAAHAQVVTLPIPTGSGQFGYSVTVLPNGNYVVTDPFRENPPSILGGAVYVYNGQTNVLISTFTGTRNGDKVGSGGITALSNGNFVISSPDWTGNTVGNVGAVTWGSGVTGISGSVSAANSLIGTQINDHAGSFITALTNGNYVVRSYLWDNGSVANTGAVTWGNGATGITGTISSSNSLVGNGSNSEIGSGGVKELANGNYVVLSPNWSSSNSGFYAGMGAVTWGNGATGISGVVSAANSLVGSSANDRIGGLLTGGNGNDSLKILSNGNYIVTSPLWNNSSASDVGAATWGNGATGTSGVVSAANSLVGSNTDDVVGMGGVYILRNNNYVVGSSSWRNGIIASAGAVTWGNGATGISGVVSAANSLVGSSAFDAVGNKGVTALSNGNYVVGSSFWKAGSLADAGAATWGSGTTGVSGPVSGSNSLVGSTIGDMVGNKSIVALPNGNYVVASPQWDNGSIQNVGAATWGNGTNGITGPVSAANSLVGSQTSDGVGSNGITALSNNNYVVGSSNWDNGSTANTGAVT